MCYNFFLTIKESNPTKKLPKTKEQAAALLKALEDEARIKAGLPHLYSFKFYKWTRTFWESRKRFNFLVGPNQCSKSSTLIRKAIHWATDKSLWKKLWPDHKQPRIFWYLYPTMDIVDIEVKKKWIPEFLPQGDYKNDPTYGWRLIEERGKVVGIDFFSGVTIYFKSYAQNAQHLQAGTVFAVFCFAAGTKVITRCGEKNIEDVKTGDVVLSKSGWNRVTNTHSHVAPKVITREFSNGQLLTATPDHPFYADSQWVQYGTLDSNNTCYSVPLCRLTKKLFYLTASFTCAIQNIKTIAREIISGQNLAEPFTSNYGKLSTEKPFLKALLSITKISTHLITGLKTCSYSQGPSTPSSTREKSGSLESNTRSLAFTAKKQNSPEVQSDRSSTVLENVLEPITRLIKIVRFVLNHSHPEKTHDSVFALPCALIAENTRVYNLTVENDPTFYANGILVHNCDEEIPIEVFPEVKSRLTATRGYYHAAFTATLGQDFWRQVIEDKSKNNPMLSSLRMQVSLYDCMTYEDGTPSMWTKERIEEEISLCPNDREVQRRIFGKFVKAEGLKYPSFDRMKNVRPAVELPKDWLVYAGIDIGSGSPNGGHPSAITFLAVRPDFKVGRVFKHWNGKGTITTAADVLRIFQTLRGNMRCVGQTYDYSARDFYTIASRTGESFMPADKTVDVGDNTLNSLFKHMMLIIDDIPENQVLISQMENLSLGMKKSKAVDDSADSLRYCALLVPWDWMVAAMDLSEAVVESCQTEAERRKEWVLGTEQDLNTILEAEIDEWNSYYEV